LSVYSSIYSQQNASSYSGLFKVREGIPNAWLHITKGTATVAFLGGSITYNPGWRDSVCQYLQMKFSQTTFHFINAGIPSLGSLPDVFRLQQDVLDSGKIDLLFVEAAVNDRVNQTDSITQVRSLEGIVRHARNINPTMDIILMSFAGPEKLKDYEKGKIPVEVKNHEMIASHYNLPSINLAKEVYDRIKAGEFSWKGDFKDVHPSPFGQRIYSNTMKELLEKCFSKSVNTANEILYPVPTPLDKWNFEDGKYMPIQKAHLYKGFKLVENWQPKEKIQTREGFVNRPMLEATTPGASLSLSFKGTAIGMAIISGPDAGKVEYSIDNGVYQSIDLYTQWSSYLHLPWYVLFNGALENKQHELKVRILKDKNSASKGTACRIVYFLLNE
jgi:sialidase-1